MLNYIARVASSTLLNCSRSSACTWSHLNNFSGISRQLQDLQSLSSPVLLTRLHVSAQLNVNNDGLKYPPYDEEVSAFHRHNLKKYPPQQPGEPPRPAFVCHEKRNIKYYPKKMEVVARFIRGMSIEDAINQLKFCPMKGAVDVLETLLEAQKMAVEEHNVEFASNLWVSESFCLKDSVIKTIRRHSKMRIGVIKHRYVHYCCTLEEGKPPEHYYHYRRPLQPQEQLEEWLQEKRDRVIPYGL